VDENMELRTLTANLDENGHLRRLDAFLYERNLFRKNGKRLWYDVQKGYRVEIQDTLLFFGDPSTTKIEVLFERKSRDQFFIRRFFFPLLKTIETMKAYVFPGQGAQFSGMGKELYDSSNQAKELFDKANEVFWLFYNRSHVPRVAKEELTQTNITQPAVFLHSVIKALTMGRFSAGYGCWSFTRGVLCTCCGGITCRLRTDLKLVSLRAQAMQKACEINPSTMAAIIGLDDKIVEEVCDSIDEVVVAANYNCPGQLVISGSHKGIEEACEILKVKGARRALVLPVGGAFHSPLMEPARTELEAAIEDASFSQPKCPVYQNVSTKGETNPDEIKANLIAQLTAPVKWTQSVQNMIKDGAKSFTEVGPGRALQGMVAKIDRSLEITGVS
jgi:[acyl-carrier-protein] S-malonyltransferase